MGFWEGVAGHGDYDSIRANFDLIDQGLQALTDLKTAEVMDANDAIKEAVNKLNNVKGMEYVGSVDAGAVDTVTDSINTTIGEIITAVTEKEEMVKSYDSAEEYEHVCSTLAMGLAKVGEGALSVVEGLGDGVNTLIGWTIGIFSDEAAEDWADYAEIETNWSHDVFSGYYESDYAKASNFTEDSIAAGCFKTVGQTVTLLYAGGFVSGAASELGLGTKIAEVSNIGGKVVGAASSSTWGATTVAGISTLGNETGKGMQAGKTFMQASDDAKGKAVLAAGTAFIAGKAGEGLSKYAAVKDASKALDSADEALDSAKTALDQADDAVREAGEAMTNPDVAKGYAENMFDDALDARVAAKTAVDEADDAYNAAKEALTDVKASKWSTYEGYSDSITKAGQADGAQFVKNVRATKDVITDGVSALGKTASSIRSGEVDVSKSIAAEEAQNTFKESVKNLGSELKTTVTDNNAVAHGVKTIASGTKTVASNTVNGVKNFASTAKDAGVDVALAQTANKAVTTVATGVVNTVTNPSIAGKVGAATVAIENNAGDASSQFKITSNPTNLSGSGAESKITNPKKATETTIPQEDGGDDSGGENDQSHVPSGGYSPSGGTTPTDTGSTNNDSNEQFKEVTDTIKEIKQDTTKVDDGGTASIQPIDIKEEPTPTTPIDHDTPTDDVVVVTPTPTDNTPTVITTNPTDGGGTTTTGGGYSRSGGYTSSSSDTPTTTPPTDGIKDSVRDIDDIIRGNNKTYKQIPKSSSVISKKSTSGAGSSVIPIAAGLSAAAAAGIGAKAYIDRKKNNDNGEDEDDFDTEEWSENGNLDIDYSEDSDNKVEENLIDEDNDTYASDDDYAYQEAEEEKYDARNNEELADLQ